MNRFDFSFSFTLYLFSKGVSFSFIHSIHICSMNNLLCSKIYKHMEKVKVKHDETKFKCIESYCECLFNVINNRIFGIYYLILL